MSGDAIRRHEARLKTLRFVQGMCPHWPMHDVPVAGLTLVKTVQAQLEDAIQKIVRPDLSGQALVDCVEEWDVFKHDQVATLLNLQRKNGNLTYQFGEEQKLEDVFAQLEIDVAQETAGSW